MYIYSVLCYNEAEVCSEKGRRLLAPHNRATAEEMQAAINADLEMISDNNKTNKTKKTNGTSSDSDGDNHTAV